MQNMKLTGVPAFLLMSNDFITPKANNDQKHIMIRRNKVQRIWQVKKFYSNIPERSLSTELCEDVNYCKGGGFGFSWLRRDVFCTKLFLNDEAGCRRNYGWLFDYCITVCYGQFLEYLTMHPTWSSLDEVHLLVVEQFCIRS